MSFHLYRKETENCPLPPNFAFKRYHGKSYPVLRQRPSYIRPNSSSSANGSALHLFA